jgi:O-antigen ligase
MLIAFLLTFIYVITHPPIFSPDSYSYYGVSIVRYPVYILFLRGLSFVFGENYDYVVIVTQVLFNFLAIAVVLDIVSKLFLLKRVSKWFLLLVLLFPLLPPLAIANNLVSEGLSYPFYLFLISFSLEFLYNNSCKNLYYLAITYLLLTLTRGQFIIIPIIIAFIFFFKHRKQFFRKKTLFSIALLLILPFVSTTLDSLFKKAVYGYYISTPYSYVNAVTLPLYVSELKDTLDIKNVDDKKIFIQSYKHIDSLGLLSTKVISTNRDKYLLFHDNFPYICNQNIHEYGKKHFFKENEKPYQSFILSEESCKRLFPVLLKNHFKEWLVLYYQGIVNGLYSAYILALLLFVLILSGLKTLLNYDNLNAFVFFTSLLLLSNSMIVAFACHSIIRYVFYNFFLGFIVIILYLRRLNFKL